MMAPPRPVYRDRGGGFRSRYKALKEPTMMLLWNRRFSDEVQSDYVDRTTVRSGSAALVTRTPDATYGAGATEIDITSGRTRLREGQPGANLNAEDDAAVETAFMDSLQANGVRFVDRSVSMRTARGARSVGGDANIQSLETDALMARTSMLIEVSQISASDSPIGTKFRVTVKNLKTAAVLTSFTSNGVPDMGRPGLVAGPNGFERAQPRRPSAAAIGAELADEVMERLSGSLR